MGIRYAPKTAYRTDITTRRPLSLFWSLEVRPPVAGTLSICEGPRTRGAPVYNSLLLVDRLDADGIGISAPSLLIRDTPLE